MRRLLRPLQDRVPYPHDWRAFTLAQFIDAVDAYIRWHNETRNKLSLGGRSSIEYRKSLGLMP
jgi:putative transposase